MVDHFAAVAPEAEMREAFRVADGLIERQAREGGLDGDIDDSPKTGSIERVHITQAQLKDAEDPLAGVQTAVGPVGGVFGDERGKAMTIRSEKQEALPRTRNCICLGEDLSPAQISHEKSSSPTATSRRVDAGIRSRLGSREGKTSPGMSAATSLG